MADREPTATKKKDDRSVATRPEPDPSIYPGLEARIPDPVELSRTMASIAERSQRLVADFLTKHPADRMSPGDPLNLGQAFFQMTARMMSNPAKMVEAQMSLWRDYLSLWQNATARMMGHHDAMPAVEPEHGDKRFKDAAWQENQLFDFIKQSYLLSARWIQSTVEEVEGLDDTTARKVDFYTRQFVDAMAPSNFILTNPEVLRATLESSGENLLKGLENLLHDLELGEGQLKIRMTDLEAFEVGRNLATTPGKVIYENDLMQLLQYEPTTEKAHKRPLLVIPPWINKYYILDLRQKNSFVRWAVDQGFTVFVISWVNPDTHLAEKSFTDYMLEGPLEALDAIGRATGEPQANAVGYCLGGTLLASTLGYMAAKGDTRVASATYLTTMIDFAEAGELSVFIDEEQLRFIEASMEERGYLDGAKMATTFNMLRANDLIWSFVVNNYLMGKEPFPFDLLYWNSDSTRMPAAMHSFYLRKMYQENKLIERGGVELNGVPLDLRAVETPAYILATREDHIAPWMATYQGTQTYAGPKTMVLSGSGHIAGVVNPPEAGRYGYWTNDALPSDPEDWLVNSTRHDGSWWPHWAGWLRDNKHAGAMVKARRPGDGELRPIEDAPGRYVKVKATG